MKTSSSDLTPDVGSWYQDPLGRRFEVVSLDREAGLIQVQYEDGKLGELDLADWRHTMQEKVGSPYEYMTSVDDDEA
jgi:hypothetical protein